MFCWSACCLFAALIFCLLPAPTRADDAHDIRAAYNQLDAAYSRRDVPAIIGFLTPGFQRVKWNAVLPSAEFQAELKDDFDGTASATAKTRFKSLNMHGDTADAIVVRRLDWSYFQPVPEQPPPYFHVGVTREVWRKAQGQWRMAKMADTSLFQTLCLLNMRDQSLRVMPAAEWKKPAVVAQVEQIDAADQVRLKQIIHQYGWPGFDLAGTEGEEDAFFIVQHSDDDKAFQKRCLPLIEAAVKAGQAMPSDVAYLTDRILWGEHKPQIYGTQWNVPIADPAHVDARRAAVGLAPLAVYEAQLKQIYGSPKKH
jgi:ketosteroid isomerase-like protein